MAIKELNYSAGRPFDAAGHAASFWEGTIVYFWDYQKQTFHVWNEQVLGTGTVTNSYSNSIETNDVDNIIVCFKELEAHYKKVYSE